MLESVLVICLAALFCERALARFTIYSIGKNQRSAERNALLVSLIAGLIALITQFIITAIERSSTIPVGSIAITVFFGLLLAIGFFLQKNTISKQKNLLAKHGLLIFVCLFLAASMSIALDQLSGTLEVSAKLFFLLASITVIPAFVALVRRANFQNTNLLRGWPVAILCSGMLAMIFYSSALLFERHL